MRGFASALPARAVWPLPLTSDSAVGTGVVVVGAVVVGVGEVAC
jgi:hypothetical protein